MSSNTVAPMNLCISNGDSFNGYNFTQVIVDKLNNFSKDVANKFESQEKEIDFLKKNALAQEIKINELSKIVDMLMVRLAIPSITQIENDRETKRAIGEIMTYGNEWAPEVNKRLIAEGLQPERYGITKMAREIIEAKREEIKENERKAQAEIVRLQVEAQEKLKAQELAETKEKAMKDMMARVALLEENAKKEEEELENLKLVSEPKTDEEIEDEDPKIQELLMREANALARAAEMRAEKAKLRGTQKTTTKDSTDPSTWSKEKAEKVSQMWVE